MRYASLKGTMDIAISVKNISKSYRMYPTPADRLKELLHPFGKKYHQEFWALKDVSFDVKKGECVGIIGRNGCGKSTLLQIICGLLQPTNGEVKVKGRISALLELGAGFNREFSGRDNVYMNGALMGISREEMNEKFDAIADFADIGEFIEQPVKTYSSGMFVRLAFACAVNVDPDILIVDEALSVGDMAFQQKCLERLAILRERGVTIALVTHDIMLTRKYCSFVVYLVRGNVKTVADPEIAGEIYIKDTHEEVKAAHRSAKVELKEEGTALVRYGNKRGELTHIELWNKDERITSYEENDVMRVSISARIDDSIKYPTIVLQFRDSRGYTIYGVRTKSENIVRIKRDEGVFIKAILTLKVILIKGRYSITVSLNDQYSRNIQTILDKQVGAATFDVISGRPDEDYHGIVNLNAAWEQINTKDS